MANNDPTYAPAGVGGVQGVSTEAASMLQGFWPDTMNDIRRLRSNDFKAQELPLARIKKIMKLDEDVKMISAEAPVLFAKAAEIFISEVSLRSWIHTEDNKRRTLQKNDIAMAVTKYDQFDFLIDIVPRDEIKTTKRPEEGITRAAMMPDQVQYYFKLAQQHQADLQTAAQPVPQQQPQQQQATAQVVQQPVQVQVMTPNEVLPVSFSQATTDGSGAAVIQVQPTVTQQMTTQVYQQVTAPNGEIQTIPIQLTHAQLQAIAAQMQGKQPGQPIIIQTAVQQAAAPAAEPINTAAAAVAAQFSSTQPLFQVPLIAGTQPMTIGSPQQIYIQHSVPPSQDDQATTQVISAEEHAG